MDGVPAGCDDRPKGRTITVYESNETLPEEMCGKPPEPGKKRRAHDDREDCATEWFGTAYHVRVYSNSFTVGHLHR